MVTTKKLISLAAIVLLGAPIAANAALVSTDGGLGVYDTVNNVTWTSDANLFATQAASYSGGAAAFVSAVIADSGGVIHDTPNSFDPSGTYTLSASDFSTGSFPGQMTWWGAQAWVNYLNVTNYGGSNQWALPTTVDNSASGSVNPAQSSSQMAQLFYGGLGQVAGSSITTTHNGSYALFSNVQSYLYWSGTENLSLPPTTNATAVWSFNTNFGNQAGNGKHYSGLAFGSYALAVSPGQVNPVPLPAAAWLLLSGLGGLGALTRKKRAAVAA